jgi:GTP-binding protein
LIDAAALDASHILEAYDTVNAELTAYSAELIQKPQLIVLNKMDLPESGALAARFQSALGNREVTTISAETGTGVDQLISRIVQVLDHNRKDE